MKVKVPDVKGPAGLCWKQGPTMERCDRPTGHKGPHLWELTRGSVESRALAVTRLEVIDSRYARIFSMRPVELELSFQDNDRTLKVFTNSEHAHISFAMRDWTKDGEIQPTEKSPKA